MRNLRALLLLLIIPSVRAANSLMIWPIDPAIASEDKASELWLENRGSSSTIMQVRIFAWQQREGQEQYQTQQQVAASPPMVRLEPGQKQLVRLIKQTPPPAGQESAYRVVLDEIPSPRKPDDNQAGLNFQMRYSVPLFVYGSGLTRDSAKAVLSWREVSSGGRRWLELTNSGSGHARLSNFRAGGAALGNGLFGYVLAHSSQRWPVSQPLRGELAADVNNRAWRSTAAR
ncbi:fimbrial biogenesis chaperone [Pantoea eucrina]|uniref:Molecular chaperone n=1 Tax=Pantoea eucrina TaxID=472693 RepID=A0ABS1Z455_9GAMM|nr:molecular chaperone [Pantoea eucrina]AIX49257.1 CsuC protein [Pantoea sp. PSNIH1]MBM0746808.1 molecular chaperone [Pantoea eucrina]UBB12781.1 molecular chaperone [Pantoea eucrina]